MFFFFQAEDGIRDVAVTGVQTCALPICPVRSDQDDHLSLLQGHRDSMEDLHFPIAGPEVLRLEQHAYPPRYDSITAGSAFTVSGRPSAIRRPWCITMTQSHRFMTTFISCSIRKNVLPFCRSFSIRSMRLPANAGLTPATGSSRRTSVGSDINARESSRSFFCPPDSVLACSLASPSSCVNFSTSRPRARHCLSSRLTWPGRKKRLSKRSPELFFAARTRFSKTVRLRSSWGICHVFVSPRCTISYGGSPSILVPSNQISPSSGR